jgi:hypothetical protein
LWAVIGHLLQLSLGDGFRAIARNVKSGFPTALPLAISIARSAMILVSMRLHSEVSSS